MPYTDFVQTSTKVLTSTIFENLSPSGGFSERSYDWEREEKKQVNLLHYISSRIHRGKKENNKENGGHCFKGC